LATDPGDVVFDPCAGSMTTVATATEMGRYAIACERERE
jgi:DNA modification methylase